MKKIILFLIMFFAIITPIFAKEIDYDLKFNATPNIEEQNYLIERNSIQSRIDNISANILNLNKIPKRIIFVYDDKDKKRLLSSYDVLTKRQVIIYKDKYNSIENDDELAAVISREISGAMKSYSGMWGGRIDSLQIVASSKKFEVVADKRAVDYMIKANYNPLALIAHINKTCPQKRSDRISRHNLTSKRMMYIYEYITYKYPDQLVNNPYENNKHYQNFLLTSINNRSMLKEKIRTKSTKALKYE